MRNGTRTGMEGLGPKRLWRLALLLLPACLFGLALGCTSLPLPGFQAPDDEEHDKDLEQVKTIGDVTEVANVAPIPVSGVGLVVGLDGTGGPAPKGFFRGMLEDELRKQKVQGVTALLESPDNAMVLVSAQIPVGARKGDPLDVELMLPNGSRVTSLHGGTLMPCALHEYSSTHQVKPDTDKADRLLLGHIFGRAQGTVLTGLGGDDEAGQRQGRIWEGGTTFIDHPFLLVLKKDQKFAKVANAVAERINSQFQDDPQRLSKIMEHKRLLMLNEVTSEINDKFSAEKVRLPLSAKGEMAKPMSKEAVNVRVPWEYRLNPERYLLTVRLIPLREAPDQRGKYRQKLHAMLLDPARTVRGALRLEALGKASIPALKEGLQSNHPLVRFASAEALTYLGSPAGVEELTLLARHREPLRAHCLMALASLDEPATHEKLVELLEAPEPELRYGAFRALRLLDENDPHVQGTLVNHSFWLHRVEPQSAPLVHFTVGQRAEVVLFGRAARLATPLAIRAQEFTITAPEGADHCVVKRFMRRADPDHIPQRQCALQIEEVLRTMAQLGAQYADVVDLLRTLDEQKLALCPVRANALPSQLPAQELAGMGRNPDLWRVPASEGAGTIQPVSAPGR